MLPGVLGAVQADLPAQTAHLHVAAGQDVVVVHTVALHEVHVVFAEQLQVERYQNPLQIHIPQIFRSFEVREAIELLFSLFGQLVKQRFVQGPFAGFAHVGERAFCDLPELIGFDQQPSVFSVGAFHQLLKLFFGGEGERKVVRQIELSTANLPADQVGKHGFVPSLAEALHRQAQDLVLAE